jgi:hypothetical protein
VRDCDPEESGENEDGEGDDDDEGRVPDDAVFEAVVGRELDEDGAEKGPSEEALATGAHPALKLEHVQINFDFLLCVINFCIFCFLECIKLFGVPHINFIICSPLWLQKFSALPKEEL